MNRKIVKISRRILLVMMFVITVAFLVFHYDSKEYTVQNQQEYLNRICKMTHNKAVAVGIIDEDEDIYLEYCDIDGESVDKHTIFELGSTTKEFTGLGILKLEEEGLIDTDAPVTEYIEWFRPKYNGSEAVITINHLMNHSSGIPVWTISSIPQGSVGEISLEDTVRMIADVKLVHTPGEVHEYATINYDVLALIIENITGVKYEDYITDIVLKDAGMTESFFRTSDSDRECIFPGYKVGFFGTWRYDAPTYYGNTAAGYLVSNTNDLVKWMRYVKNNIDFDPFPITDSNNYYAGWNIYPEKIVHSGNNPNYGTQIFISRTGDFGVFVLSASGGDVATIIANGIREMHMESKTRIGLCVSSHELLDFLFVMSTLLILYIALLLKYKHRWLCMSGGLMILITALLIPIISHFSYGFFLVWMPYSFVTFMIGVLTLAVWLIIKGFMPNINSRD